MAEIKDLEETLDILKTKIEEFNNVLNQDKTYREDVLDMLKSMSSKIDDLAKTINLGCNENILTYVIGAFAGGLIMGLSLYKRIKD